MGHMAPLSILSESHFNKDELLHLCDDLPGKFILSLFLSFFFFLSLRDDFRDDIVILFRLSQLIPQFKAMRGNQSWINSSVNKPVELKT